MNIFLTIILFTGFCFAEEPAPKPLPKDVQTIVDAREKALQDARIAFDKAVFKANDDAVKKMEIQVKTSTQKGDLDGALASKKFVEDWNKEKESAAVNSALGGQGPKENELAQKIVGKWVVAGKGWTRVVDERGNVSTNDPKIIGKISIKNNKILITYTRPDMPKGDFDIIESISNDLTTVNVTNKTLGESFIWERSK
jgi:hypothetical protein